MSDEQRGPRATEVEQRGVERVPDAERTARPLDVFRLSFGGASTFATAVLGAFPVLFGLSFWQGLAATLLGLVTGAVVLCPMAVFGPVNGTNNAVSSSAHLGVRGRIVGSFLSLLTAVTFFAISVWSSGDALVGSAARLFGTPRSEPVFAAAYALFAVLVLVVCVFGFRLMLLVNKVAVVATTALFAVGAVAFAGDFDPGYQGPLAHAGPAVFWPQFFAAALIVLANPLSFGAFLGDWSRYVPATTPLRRVVGAALLAQLATIVPFAFGLATATVIAERAPEHLGAAPNYVGGLLAVSPGWYFPALCAIALLGGLSTGTTALYGTGLDFSSVFPRFSRARATVLIGTAAVALVFLGRFALDLVQSISTFAVLIVTGTAPWMVVLVLGFTTRRGWYDPEALQVFNRGQRGGRYWFDRGWNWRGLGAWLVSAVVGLFFVNVPGQLVGPLGELLGGVDVSLPVALLLSAGLHLALLRIFPEPRAVFGPAGPRWVPARDEQVPEISRPTGRASSSEVDGAVGRGRS